MLLLYMQLLGFGFTKFSSEKTPKNMKNKKIIVKHNFDIKDVILSPVKADGKPTKLDALTLKFECSWDYSPSFGKIIIEGGFTIGPNEENKEISKSWKKDKRLPRKHSEELLGIMIPRAILQAIVLAKEIGLPSPIEFPSVQFKKN